MLRVTTLHATSAAASAAYYAKYLAAAPGEIPGEWHGRQAAGLGLAGQVDVAQLEALLSGHDPITGTRLGGALVDRPGPNGRVTRAVAGFDATFSAPKSLSVWWALTGDQRLLDAHDAAVVAALSHLERFGSTTRIRSNGQRMHPDTDGLIIAAFRQTTSRADDPQIHTHAVISTKVQTADGRWWALDARYLKKHQRMLGGLYQSVLRNELSHRLGVDWRPLRNGQAEIAGVPDELLDVFSKRSVAIDAVLASKIEDFRNREGRTPSTGERAALTREAAADTRTRKSGVSATNLTTRWRAEAGELGWIGDVLEASIRGSADRATRREDPTGTELVELLSRTRSSWSRADVLRTLCDAQPTVPEVSGADWAGVLERATDRLLADLVDLDPPADTGRRASDGRSIWIEPIASNLTCEHVLAQEEATITWAMDAQASPPAPSTTVDGHGLDPLQHSAAAAVAGADRLTLVVGPAGAGKTRTLKAAAADLRNAGRDVFAVAPTAKAARTLQRDTGIPADTVAKLLHEWQRTDRPAAPQYDLPTGGTLIVDEAGMLTTPALHDLVTLADNHGWRLVLVGDPLQLQGVGRSGLLSELCANGHVERLERLHRFAHAWEATASLMLRSGHPRALDAYEAHDRIVPGDLGFHLNHLAACWIDDHERGLKVALVASTNEHVDQINRAVQDIRRERSEIDERQVADIGGGERAYVGDVVATRRNDRRLVTDLGEPVRNRDVWTVSAVHLDGSLTAWHQGGHGAVTLPVAYVREHVRLGYAATEHGWQSDTVDAAYSLVSSQTTRRGLYVAATRGTHLNEMCVVTKSDDVSEARDVLGGILAFDRADVPAVAQRRALAEQQYGRRAPITPPQPRCKVPSWFSGLLREARDAFAAANEREVVSTARDRQADEHVADAEHQFAVIARETAPARRERIDARTAFDEARSAHSAAERRLQAAPRRHRRSVRKELDGAATRFRNAEEHLAQVEERTAPDAERYQRARAAVDDANQEVHDTRILEMLDGLMPASAECERRVVALETWQRWAKGQRVPDDRLAFVYDNLTDDNYRHDHRIVALADALEQLTSSVELSVETSLRPDNGPSLGL